MTSQHFEGEDLTTRVEQLEEAMAVLRGDSKLRELPYGTLKDAKSHFALRSIGGTLGGAYPAGLLHQRLSLSFGSFPANYLYAVPFYLPGAPNNVVKIGIHVTGASAGTNFRLGIYADKGEKMLYPHKLLLDAGAVSAATTGTKSVEVRQGLPRGLVWVALLASHAAPTIRRIVDYMWAVLGYSEAGTAGYCHYRVAQAYGALPDPYPAGATELSGAMPYIFLKFS